MRWVGGQPPPQMNMPGDPRLRRDYNNPRMNYPGQSQASQQDGYFNAGATPNPIGSYYGASGPLTQGLYDGTAPLNQFPSSQKGFGSLPARGGQASQAPYFPGLSQTDFSQVRYQFILYLFLQCSIYI